MNQAESWAHDLARNEAEAFRRALITKEEKTMMIHGRYYSEPELQAHIKFMEDKLLELEGKHLQECREISEYDEELRRLREFIHRIRSYFGETVSWIDLFEESYMEITGGRL